jgi:hypothetical protein
MRVGDPTRVPPLIGLASYALPAVGLPTPSVSVVSVVERAVGVGQRRGSEKRNGFDVVELNGIRLDALVRFQLWAASPDAADDAGNDLHARLMTDRMLLYANGFLKLDLESSPPTDFAAALNAWRKVCDYRVLYEYRAGDQDGAESLIARIPITADVEAAVEATSVSDETVRWDDDQAPALSVRGPFKIGRLMTLAFVPGAAPNGTVTLLRTFDGASGPPIAHASLGGWHTAVTRPVAPERHAAVTFASLTAFLSQLGPAGEGVPLGDWDVDGAPDMFAPRALAFDPPVALPGASDRLEVTHQNPNLDQTAVVYLRVKV